jgi:penicillin-insensitive murein endopeptidase
MECSDKYGGKLKLHRTHKNGKSIDFMVPKKGKGFHYNNLGLLHYLLEFDENGILSLNKSVEIDFEVMAKHILTLQKAGKNHGVTIKKVILKINLKDDLWETPTGKKLKTSGIYFAQSLSKNIDDMHDDHYHIDFALSN